MNIIWRTQIFGPTSYSATKASSILLGLTGNIIRRKKNKELKHTNLRPTVKHGSSSVMVWACILLLGVGDLISIDDQINKEYYLNILKRSLRQNTKKMGIVSRFKFYQDNDQWLLLMVVIPLPQSYAHTCPFPQPQSNWKLLGGVEQESAQNVGFVVQRVEDLRKNGLRLTLITSGKLSLTCQTI